MAQYIQDLFTVAMGGGCIRRFRDLVLITLPGVALVTSRQELQQAQCWARGLRATESADEDRARLLDHLQTRIGRVDCSCPTRGSDQAIARLVRLMQTNHMDLGDWRIPQSVLDRVTPTPAALPAG